MKLPLAATVVALAVASFSVGQLFPLKNFLAPFRKPVSAKPSDSTEVAYRQFQQILTEFEADELYGASSERILQVPVAQSQRPVFFQNRVVPWAAVTLYERNMQFKQAGALIAHVSSEAEKIDYWIAKASPSKFWERRAASITGWPTLPATSASPSDTPTDHAPEVADHETRQPPAASPALLQELAEADAEFVKVGAETPGKLAVLPSPPPPVSLRPVIFRDRIVPRAAQTLYEDNEQLKRLQSPRADYSPAAEEPVFWVPKVASSVFWNHRMTMPVYQAQFRAATSKAAVESPGKSVAARSGGPATQLTGKTGYMTGLTPKDGSGSGETSQPGGGSSPKTVEDAVAKLTKLAGEKGALEQERRSAMDRRSALEGEYLKAKEDELALKADWDAWNLTNERWESAKVDFNRDAFARGWKLNKERTLWTHPDTPLHQPLIDRLEKLNAQVEELNRKRKVLDSRQESLDEKLAKIAKEKEELESKGPALTEKITAIIKEQTEVKAVMFGNKR